MKQSISCCEVDLQQASEAGNVLAPLLAFPGELRKLVVSSPNRDYPSTTLGMALDAAADTAPVRAKLASVVQLEIKVCGRKSHGHQSEFAPVS